MTCPCCNLGRVVWPWPTPAIITTLLDEASTSVVLDDEILAGHFDKLAHRPELQGDELRQALIERVSARYAEIYAMR